MNILQRFIRTFLALLISTITIGCAQTGNRNSPRTGIQHIGLVWLKQAGNADARQKVIDAVHDFGRLIPEVKSAAVGTTDGIGGPYSDTSYDICFILTFADEAARQRYNEHPVHQKAAREVFLPLSRKLLFYRFVSQ
jgi:hypothetical protein